MRLKILVTVFLLAVLSYSLFWYYSAGEVKAQIETEVKTLNSRQHSPSLTISYAKLEVGGFPTRLEVTLKNLKITASGRGGATNMVSFPAITMIAFPWNIYHVVILSKGGTARIGSMARISRIRSMAQISRIDQIERSGLAMAFGKSRASVEVDSARHQFHQISVILHALTWTTGRRHQISSARKVRLYLLRPSDSAVRPATKPTNGMELPLLMKLYFDARGVTLEGRRVNALDKKIDQAEIDLELRGNKQPAYTSNGLASWRDNGGTIVIKNLALKSGKINISLNGEATLDQDMKPLGAFSAKIHGIPRIIANLSRQSALLGPTGKMMLQQLRKMARTGGKQARPDKKAVDIAISLQGGLVFFGPIPIYELAPVIK